ncbi:zinc-binding dehydrogenase [Nocardioides insulae]|uniref:zinc-binding dehydrogenase n=1 Tax=Nocardioides insulae TaxID=394734 RepID=UPI0004181053|nr:zinc-binding dehydrogenase [Nocardioides insulae]
MTTPTTTRELRSKITSAGTLELSIEEVPLPPMGPDQVIVRVDATPINPSDLGLLLGPGRLGTARETGTPQAPRLTAEVPAAALTAVASRLDTSMPVGNEGAGVVVAAGTSEAAQALLGKTVFAIGGGMYTQFRRLHVQQLQVLPEGRTPAEGASSFVNPMTALAFLDTMRAEGHTALVHTAAASNLGQMLNRLCLADGVPLVAIVRKAEHVELLRSQGAEHVLDSTSPTFDADLVEALAATGATLAFDAIGGGTLTSQILAAMEVVASRASGEYSRYGSASHKQVYVYGALDVSPTVLDRRFGMAWGIGGWLLMPFLEKVGPQRQAELQARVMDELTTTFASNFTQEISLDRALSLDVVKAYAKSATGEKYLIVPSLGEGR